MSFLSSGVNSERSAGVINTASLLSPALTTPSFICCHNEAKEGFFLSFFFFLVNNERLSQVAKAGNFRKLRCNNKLIFWLPAANCTTATACKHNSNSYVITSSKTSCLCLERFKYPLKLQCRGWRNILRLGTTCFFIEAEVTVSPTPVGVPQGYIYKLLTP